MRGRRLPVGGRQGTDPHLTTRDLADWSGVSTDYYVGEIRDGHLPAANVALHPGRKCYRVRLSAFRAYLKRRGVTRLPTPRDFTTPAT